MKPILMLLFLYLSEICSGQNKIVGLFSNCDSAGYMCQQLLFKKDKTFAFYELLHLRGWSEGYGTWELKGDTVILNSSGTPYSLKYSGNSGSDSVVIQIKANGESLFLASVSLQSGSYQLDYGGEVKCSKDALPWLYVSSLNTYPGKIIVDQNKLKSAETIEISMDTTFTSSYFFENERWLLNGNKLHSSQNELHGAISFDKIKPSQLKYGKN